MLPRRRAAVSARRASEPQPRLAPSDQAHLRGGLARRGVYPGRGLRARQAEIAYSVRLAREVALDAVTDGANLYTLSVRGLLTASRLRDGGLRFSRNFKRAPRAAPARIGDLVVVGEPTGKVWALDATTGAVRWHVDLVGAVGMAPLASRGLIVIGTRAGRLVGLDPSSGQKRWQVQFRRPLLGGAVGPDGLLIVSCMDQQVRGVDPAHGEIRWSRHLPASSLVDPVVADGAAYVLGAGGRLHKLDARTGKTRWVRPGFGYRSFAPAVRRDAVLLTSRTGLLYCLSPKDGTERWVKPTGSAPTAPPVLVGQTVYVVTAAPRLLAVRLDSGGHYLSLKLPAPVSAPPVPWNGQLAVVDRRGLLTLYRPAPRPSPKKN